MAAILFWCTGSVAGGEKEEAVTLVREAIAFLEVNGPDKAFAEINDRDGKFVKGELYVFLYDMNGVILCHPMNPRLKGKDMKEVRDADGNYFTKSFIEVAKTSGMGWVDYKWTNPLTKKIESKSSYIERAGDYFLGCGIYL